MYTEIIIIKNFLLFFFTVRKKSKKWKERKEHKF